MGKKGTRDMRSREKTADNIVVKLEGALPRGDIRLVPASPLKAEDQETDGEGLNDEVPPLNPVIQGHLGRQLRTMYKNLVDEPVPDRFKKLLDELKAKEETDPDQRE